MAADEPVDVGAELAALGDGVPAGEAVVGGGGGGGAIAEAPEPAAPELSASTPEAGIGQLAGLRPDRLLGALGGVGQAVTRESGEARAAAAAEAPTLDLDGGAAAPAPPPVDAPPAGAAEAAPEGADTPAPAPEPTPEPAGRPAAAATPAPALSGDAEGKLSDGDLKTMAASIAKMPTRDPALSTAVGPAPAVPAEGNADPGNVTAQRQSVEKSLGEAEAAARQDVAAKLGEDRIDHQRPQRTLTARLAPGAGAAAPVIEAPAGEMMEAAGVIAQAERGGEIDAALAKARGDMAAERQKHEQARQEAHDASAEQIETLKSESAAEQAKEKANAQREVDGLRQDWQAEADRQTADARQKADAEVESGLEKVDAEKKKGEDAAQKAIDEGEKKAADEQARGEAEAEKHKQDGEKESGGLFGWLASKAKSFFDRIKNAISAAIEAARKAVKAAIDAAKALASAAIEAARKAIVAAIQIVGKALIAISDTLLAAFPALKEKFRNAIQSRVDQATEAVNALAEKGLFKKKKDKKGKDEKDEDDKGPTPAEKARVIRQAQSESERLEAQSKSPAQIQAALTRRFKARHAWIKRFEIEKGESRAVIWMIASRHKIDDIEEINWSWKSTKTFGHTFLTHGAGSRITQRLVARAGTPGQSPEQGQWLDNAAAAAFLKGHAGMKGVGEVSLPPGLGQIVSTDGSTRPATRARIVPSSKEGTVFKTAFPVA